MTESSTKSPPAVVFKADKTAPLRPVGAGEVFVPAGLDTIVLLAKQTETVTKKNESSLQKSSIPPVVVPSNQTQATQAKADPVPSDYSSQRFNLKSLNSAVKNTGIIPPFMANRPMDNDNPEQGQSPLEQFQLLKSVDGSLFSTPSGTPFAPLSGLHSYNPSGPSDFASLKNLTPTLGQEQTPKNAPEIPEPSPSRLTLPVDSPLFPQQSVADSFKPLSGASLYDPSEKDVESMDRGTTESVRVDSQLDRQADISPIPEATENLPLESQSFDPDMPTMHYDVAIVGAGPAGLSTAIRLKQNAQNQGKDIAVCILEKGAEVGAHILSGAVLEPRALNELLPDWQNRGAPLECPVTQDAFVFLTKNRHFTLPTPPQMNNHGNYIISLGQFCRWLATQAEQLGVEIYTGVTASDMVMEGNRLIGVTTGAMGVDKQGCKRNSYVSGMQIMAPYTVFAEGCRGSLSQKLMDTFDLRADCDPQTYGIGLKELWEIDPSNADPGQVMHTVGWPMDRKTYGGSFLYHLQDNKVSIGFVVGLDYQNPHLSPYMEFQRFKHHPAIAKILKGGRRLSYGARALNEGGLQSIPNTAFRGGVLVGCSAGFLNVAKIKGTHTAMKSGMVAADSLCEVVLSQADPATYPATLTSYVDNLKQSWLWDELYKVRNIRPSFHKGLWAGLAYSALDTFVFRGNAPWTFRNHSDHSQLKKIKDCKPIDYPKPDGVLSFDRLTNVSYSNTHHEENQPVHLTLKDTSVPIAINLTHYDAPEQRYCPAGVYEIVGQGADKRLQINAQNCIHCKTCDIKDPTQNIIWTCPEGTGGPNYSNM